MTPISQRSSVGNRSISDSFARSSTARASFAWRTLLPARFVSARLAELPAVDPHRLSALASGDPTSKAPSTAQSP
ncbi:hypothetical protein [Sorangium sp. So ce394]|uniref:hypothetical protein n=1 Tax=Sorangium sp. So ce394 TaxID=3133310 RepID=UPI003F5CB040